MRDRTLLGCRRSGARARSAVVDTLESRRLLAAVAWDGGGDGTSCTDPLRWSTNAVPGAADDVTIDVAGSPTIVLTGSRAVRSLVNAETLRILRSAEGSFCC